MDGGDGIDTLSYAGSTQWVTVFLYANQAVGADGYGDSFASFENVRGGMANDSLLGNVLANRIEGGKGNDYLSGEGGADMLYGGGGSDTFHFWAGSETDRVMDFAVGGTDDRIFFNLSEDFDSFDEVMAMAQTVSGNTVFSFGNGLSLILEGVTKASLTKQDFFFPDYIE